MCSFTSRLRRYIVRKDDPTAVDGASMRARFFVASIAIVGSPGTSISHSFRMVNNAMS